jgi:hypothetical protein
MPNGHRILIILNMMVMVALVVQLEIVRIHTMMTQKYLIILMDMKKYIR